MSESEYFTGEKKATFHAWLDMALSMCSPTINGSNTPSSLTTTKSSNSQTIWQEQPKPNTNHKNQTNIKPTITFDLNELVTLDDDDDPFDLNDPPNLHANDDDDPFDLNDPPNLHANDDEDPFDLNEPPNLHVNDDETSFWSFQASQGYQSNRENSDSSTDGWSIASDEVLEYEWRNTYPEHDHIIETFQEVEEDENNIAHGETENPPKRHKMKVLNNDERTRVANILLANSHNATKLPRGMINELAHMFGVSRWSISRIWKIALKHYKAGQAINVHNNRVGKVGKKRIQLDTQRLMAIPLRKRTTLRSLAHAMKMSKSTLHRLVKRGAIKVHSNAMKPELTPIHKYQRMQWCVSAIIPSTIRTIPRFQAMYNILHMDEKWFCMSKCTQKYYIAPEEELPYRACRSKKFITKLMFVGVVGRPQFTETGVEIFDGKIGIFPLTEKVVAKRSSKNRPAGTLETKAIQSVTQEVIKATLIDEVLPAIRDKWPRHMTTTVWIQQDNAKPHIDGNDEDFIHAASLTGLDIKLINQPAKSPDLNVLDLGLFHGFQSVKDQTAPKNVDQLVEAVVQAYNSYSPRLINYTWLSLQYCMCEILKVKGGNNYSIPHHKKAVLERQGMLPLTIELTPQLVNESINWLQQSHQEEQTTEQHQVQHPINAGFHNSSTCAT